MSYEDQTQRLRVTPATTDLDTPAENTSPETTGPADTTSADTTTALPGPLDLAGPTPPAAVTSDTDVLSLDDMFEPSTDPPARADAAAEAPTWTAMPVVSVRSEPISPPAAPPAPPAPTPRRRSELGLRVRSDAAAAWTGARTRTQDWLGRDDHALMIMTALVAIVLIIVVAALGT